MAKSSALAQVLLISSRLNDLMNCSTDLMMLYISGRDQARKLKFNTIQHDLQYGTNILTQTVN